MNGQGIQLRASGLACIRDDRVLFSELDFTLGPGEVLLLEGRNGSGKTSLLRILCSIRLPDEGTVLWCDEDIQELGPDYHARLSYIGHRDGIKHELTAQENLRMARALGTPDGRWSIDRALEAFGLYGFEDVPTRNLSAGQQRRVALSRLLITRAPLWILDEPFTSLDRHGIQAFEGVMERHTREGGMIVLTTHHRVRLADAPVHAINLSHES